MFPEYASTADLVYFIVSYTALTLALCEAKLIQYMVKYSNTGTPIKRRSLILFDVPHVPHISPILIILLAADILGFLMLLGVLGTKRMEYIGDIICATSFAQFIALAIFSGCMILIDHCTLRDGHQSLARCIRNGKGGNAKAEDLEKAAPQQTSKEYATSVGSCDTLQDKEIKVEPEVRWVCSWPKSDGSECDYFCGSGPALKEHIEELHPLDLVCPPYLLRFVLLRMLTKGQFRSF